MFEYGKDNAQGFAGVYVKQQHQLQDKNKKKTETQKRNLSDGNL